MHTKLTYICISLTITRLVYPHEKNSRLNVGGIVLQWVLESENVLTPWGMKQSIKNMTCGHTHVIMGIWYG